MKDLSFARNVVDELDPWVNELARPLLPPRQTETHRAFLRFEFKEHLPHTVMVGKLARAASAVRCAFAIADAGFITESGALLRMVSDFCSEIGAIGGALQRDDRLPKAVQSFVAQYFTPRATTPDDYAAAERIRYVSREALLKADIGAIEAHEEDLEQVFRLRRFLNMTGDAYVHGAYETTMELCDPTTGRLHLNGHPAAEPRHDHCEFAALKLHEVVIAVELTAAVTSCSPVFDAARKIRREMDDRDPWKLAVPSPA